MAVKTFTIIINGTEHSWSDDTISYAQVVTLDVPDYQQHPEIVYSVQVHTRPREQA